MLFPASLNPISSITSRWGQWGDQAILPLLPPYLEELASLYLSKSVGVMGGLLFEVGEIPQTQSSSSSSSIEDWLENGSSAPQLIPLLPLPLKSLSIVEESSTSEQKQGSSETKKSGKMFGFF